MLIDYIAWTFVENPLLSLTMHAVGRITAPIMCFFIAEGYRHTSSFPRYLARLLLFALVAQVPFAFFAVGRFAIIPVNVLYTLALGLLALYSHEKIRHEGLRMLAIAAILFFALPGDWSAFAVLLCLIFHILRGRPLQQTLAILGIALLLFLVDPSTSHSVWDGLYHFGILFSVPLLSAYNGKKGGSRGSRWLFYIFYPAHLAILAVLRILF